MVAAAVAVAALMLSVWAVGTAIKDVSIVDIFWGPMFALAGWAARVFSDGDGAAGTLALVCVTVWALRLGTHIARRNVGHGEDPRYVEMRQRDPGTFWIRSLGTIFVTQGALAYLVGLPVILSASRHAGGVGVAAVAGLVVWAVGLFFEAVGDFQLDAFKKRPDSKGKVMDEGLWRYTRHPNYFGDITAWWGTWVICLDGRAPVWTVVGPIAMTFFIIRVSGVALTEKTIGSRRAGYDEYVRRTSAFIPLPPKSS